MHRAGLEYLRLARLTMQTGQPRASPSRIDAAQSSRTRAAESAKRALLSVMYEL